MQSHLRTLRLRQASSPDRMAACFLSHERGAGGLALLQSRLPQSCCLLFGPSETVGPPLDEQEFPEVDQLCVPSGKCHHRSRRDRLFLSAEQSVLELVLGCRGRSLVSTSD